MARFELRLKEILKTERGAKIALIVFVAFVLAIDLIYFVFPNDVTKGASLGAGAGSGIFAGSLISGFRDHGRAFLYGLLWVVVQVGVFVMIDHFVHVRGVRG